MRSQLVRPDRSQINTDVERQMEFVQKGIEAIRAIRGEMGIPPSREIPLVMKTSAQHPDETIRQYEGYLQRLARVGSLSFIQDGGRPKLSASAVVDGSEFFVPLEGVIDISLEKARLQKEIDRITTLLNGIREKLDEREFRAACASGTSWNESVQNMRISRQAWRSSG